MSEFTTEQIKHIQRLSSFLSNYYKWEYTTQKNSIQLTIQTDDWLVLVIRTTPHKIDTKWKLNNNLFDCLIGWYMVRILKKDRHIQLEKNALSYLSKAINLTSSNKTLVQSEPFA